MGGIQGFTGNVSRSFFGNGSLKNPKNILADKLKEIKANVAAVKPKIEQQHFQEDLKPLTDTISDSQDKFTTGFDVDPEVLNFSIDQLIGKKDRNGRVGGIANDLVNAQNAFGQTVTDSNKGLQGFQGQLGGVSDRLGQIRGDFESRLGGLRQRFQGISTGEDPRFEALRQAQLGQLDSNQQAQQAQQAGFFGRRGLGGSSAALNAQQQLAGGFDAQRNTLTAQLGMQQLGRQDQALQQLLGINAQQAQFGAGLEGQRAGITGQQAGLQQQQLQNRLGQLDRLGQAKMQRAGIFQSAAGLETTGQQLGLSAREQNLNALSANIENLSIPVAFDVEREKSFNAENAGK